MPTQKQVGIFRCISEFQQRANTIQIAKIDGNPIRSMTGPDRAKFRWEIWCDEAKAIRTNKPDDKKS
jgi:hypothetical protein